MQAPEICRYCGSVIRLIPAGNVYRWLAKQMDLPAELAHIGGFEMEQCQRLIALCHHMGDKEAA